MRSLLEKSLDLAFGAALVTREKAQEFVDELIKRGEAAKDESGSLVDDIVRRGHRQREALLAMIQREVGEAVGHVNVANRDEVARLERRIRELETRLESLTGKPLEPVAPAAPRVEGIPPDAQPPIKA